MNKLNAIKIGNVINVLIDNVLMKKIFDSNDDANVFYKKINEYNKSFDENILSNILSIISPVARVKYLDGFEINPQTNEVYINGLNTPVPSHVLNLINEYVENGYPVESIVRFWSLLMSNPDAVLRNNLLEYLFKFDFVLTEHGYFVAYKSVVKKIDKAGNKLAAFVNECYNKVKRWKHSPSKYIVLSDGDRFLIKKESEIIDSKYKIIGNLNELYHTKYVDIYTDKHSHTMTIMLNVPVTMDRNDCDNNHSKSCSTGLHVGATAYVNTFVNPNDVVLVCLINPANVVSIPNSENSKMRVCEYYPYAVTEYFNGKIVPVKGSYLDVDYINYEYDKLKLLQSNDTQLKSLNDDRDLNEMKSIIKNRIIYIESVIL